MLQFRDPCCQNKLCCFCTSQLAFEQSPTKRDRASAYARASFNRNDTYSAPMCPQFSVSIQCGWLLKGQQQQQLGPDSQVLSFFLFLSQAKHVLRGHSCVGNIWALQCWNAPDRADGAPLTIVRDHTARVIRGQGRT